MKTPLKTKRFSPFSPCWIQPNVRREAQTLLALLPPFRYRLYSQVPREPGDRVYLYIDSFCRPDRVLPSFPSLFRDIPFLSLFQGNAFRARKPQFPLCSFPQKDREPNRQALWKPIISGPKGIRVFGLGACRTTSPKKRLRANSRHLSSAFLRLCAALAQNRNSEPFVGSFSPI